MRAYTQTHTSNGTELIKILKAEEEGFESGLKSINSISNQPDFN